MGHDCEGCAHGAPAPGLQGLQRLGRLVVAERSVALVGNPNTGKSTLFNALSGRRQRVGNWAGTTVAGAEGGFRYAGTTYRVIDLPGSYSLLAADNEEGVTRDFLLAEELDAIVVVVDATRLERTLPLALQVIELSERVVVAVNFADELCRLGHRLDLRHLVREIGVPAVAITARTSEGLDDLLATLAEVSGAAPEDGRPALRRRAGLAPSPAAARLTRRIEQELPHLRHPDWVARRLLEGDPGIARALLEGALAGRVTERVPDTGSRR